LLTGLPLHRRFPDNRETPLAVPILCGPGTITTGILLSSQATNWVHSTVLVANVTIIYVATYHLLRVAAAYSHVFGETTLKIITRLMGLLLLAIAVQFFVDGVRAVGFTAS
jgi:multiple antibiotic resistance protein